MSNRTSQLPTLDEIEVGTAKGWKLALIRGSVKGPLSLATRLEVVGLENVPMEGPVLVVSNHLHNADPLIEYFSFPRPIRFMGKKELWDSRIAGFLSTYSGGFPVDRGTMDREAIRQAEARLEYGFVLGMYPEGTRSVTHALTEAHGGAGLIALRSDAPILPVALTGSEKLPFNSDKDNVHAPPKPAEDQSKGVKLVIGEPFTIPREIDGKRVNATDATTIMMIEIARLLPPSYRGVYADRLDAENPRRAQPWPPRSPV